jgi:hypothetical protein
MSTVTADVTSGRAAAVATTVLFAGIALFQVALALGAPWGRAAWGGAHPGVLPAGLRIASGFAAVFWVFAAWVVLERVGLASLIPLDTTFLRWAMWALVGLSCLAVVMNLASPSPLERLIWVPVSVALAVLCLIVARSAPAA